MKKLTYLIVFACAFLFSCGEPDENIEDPGDVNQVEEFNIVGKWTFQTVSGTGQISGFPQNDSDEEPDGFIEFFENGQGFSNFSIELLGQTIAKQENIQWERIGDLIVDIEEEDGAHEIWTLINANEDMIEAEWTLDFGPTNNAVITMMLIR